MRDLALIVLPSTAFVWEALKDKPSVELLLLYMALISFPGLSGAWFLARHGGGGTGSLPPPPPEQPPSPLPPSSSSTAS
ncbi:hypothetical protein [Actinomadura decatromicini]|uniref:Uncharacterized protein n=1 Tax=Actinomadura decatromicini TaxID=2604572 RepID=A0A5D3FAA9_9ACTN|nr:hypothetical protein [Actinomadura decatromicini]TYK45143.1 hypothetical protein FXF68_31170 [Actinomadura decatromicini]